LIRFATKDDIPAIMEFIDEYWKKGHILATDKEFFNYEMTDPDGVHFVISENDDGKINGIEGFIPYGYDANEKRDVMTVVWKVIQTENKSEKDGSPMLGINILNYIVNNTNSRFVASPGINTKTIPLYKFLGYHTGTMKHFYRLGNQNELKLAKANFDDKKTILEKVQYNLVFISTFSELAEKFSFEDYKALDKKPYKTPEYIEHRYFKNPIYNYDVFGIKSNEKCGAVIFLRELECKGVKIAHLVDCIGDWNLLSNIGNSLDGILCERGYEYIDLYEIGLSDEILLRAGFNLKDKEKEIIPNYFEPFEPVNVDIHYFSTDESVVLFRGDGDQDRPSRR